MWMREKKQKKITTRTCKHGLNIKTRQEEAAGRERIVCIDNLHRMNRTEDAHETEGKRSTTE